MLTEERGSSGGVCLMDIPEYMLITVAFYASKRGILETGCTEKRILKT